MHQYNGCMYQRKLHVHVAHESSLAVTWILCFCLFTPQPVPEPALRIIHPTPTFSITFSKSPSIDVHVHSPANA